MISAAQCRAARALLNWNQPDLAGQCGIHIQTISAFENEAGSPSKTTLEKIIRTFELSGIIFLQDDGVKKANNTIVVLEGKDANKEYLNKLYEDLKDKPGAEVLIAGVSEADKSSPRRRFVEDHVRRLYDAGITERVIIEEGDTNFIGPVSSYRWMPKKFFSPVPIQLYEDKLAMIDLAEDQRVLLIENALFARAFRKLFNFAWEHCKKPNL